MKTQINSLRCIKWVLSVMAATFVVSSHAQGGGIEFHGVMNSPGCQLGLQSLQRLSGQTQLSGQTCRVTHAAENPLSSAVIAQVKEEMHMSPEGSASSKRLMTLIYR